MKDFMKRMTQIGLKTHPWVAACLLAAMVSVTAGEPPATPSKVQSAQLSPDGQRVVTATADGT